MTQSNAFWEDVEELVKELIQFHQTQLLKCGRRLVPYLTPDDLLQPNDYQELELNPHFRYEEGVLAGVQATQMALQELKKRRFEKK